MWSILLINSFHVVFMLPLQRRGITVLIRTFYRQLSFTRFHIFSGVVVDLRFFFLKLDLYRKMTSSLIFFNFTEVFGFSILNNLFGFDLKFFTSPFSSFEFFSLYIFQIISDIISFNLIQGQSLNRRLISLVVNLLVSL